jgi:hypothetical protein
MAQSQDRQYTDCDDFVITLERDPLMPLRVHDEIIREALANQRCVIVPGHLEGPESFSNEEIGADMGWLSRLVQWNGQCNLRQSVFNQANFQLKMPRQELFRRLRQHIIERQP